jgi:hypothetical protein
MYDLTETERLLKAKSVHAHTHTQSENTALSGYEIVLFKQELKIEIQKGEI